jgi:hypothetical protein
LIKEVKPTSVNNMQLIAGPLISVEETKGNTFEERKKKRNGYPQPERREEHGRLVFGDGRPQRDGYLALVSA